MLDNRKKWTYIYKYVKWDISINIVRKLQLNNREGQ